MNDFMRRIMGNSDYDYAQNGRSDSRRDYNDGTNYSSGDRRDNARGDRNDYARGMDRNDYNKYNQREEEYNYDVRYQKPYDGHYPVNYENYQPHGVMPFRINGNIDYSSGDRHQQPMGGMNGMNMKLSKKDIQKWKRRIKNADGSEGEHFNVQQLIPYAEKLGIKFKDYDEKELCLAANLIYSDYCEVLKPLITPDKEDMIYTKLAKAFMEDEDAPEGSEKLYLYYMCIADIDE